MQIFSAQGTITPADDKTNIRLAFTVPDGIRALTVNYRYAPKHIEDEHLAAKAITDGLKRYNADVVNASSFLPVSNLITLSFDENGRYRGACHRQPNDQTIIIADTDSTPGIYNRPLLSGEWCAVLNVHYAGCEISYTIDIDGEAEQ